MKFEYYNVKPQEKQIKKSVLNFNYTKTQKAASLLSWSRRFYILLKSLFIFILGQYNGIGGRQNCVLFSLKVEISVNFAQVGFNSYESNDMTKQQQQL